MKTLLSAAFVALLGISAAGVVSAPASAQSFDIGPGGVRINPDRGPDRGPPDRGPDRYRNSDNDDGISRSQALRIARRAGVDDVDNVVGTRRTWRVFGEDRRGNDVRVEIDRDSGDVLSVRQR